MTKTRFEWDPNKDQENQEKHGIPFVEAQYAPPTVTPSNGASERGNSYYRRRLLAERQGKAIYERENQVHR